MSQINSNSPSSSNEGDNVDGSVYRLVFIGLITRIAVDSSVKIFFPFLPIIAAGLGISEVTAGRLVSLRGLTGLVAPLTGFFADRRGYRPTMQISLIAGAVGYFMVGISQNIWTATIGMVIAGLGTYSFTPILVAYLSARLPFDQRSRGIGILEYAWALAGIIGLSLIGYLIEATSWRVPFYVLSGLLLVAGIAYTWLPASRPKREEPAKQPAGNEVRNFLKSLFELGDNRVSILAVFGTGLFTMTAGNAIFINYGTWLSREYGLGPVELGQIAFILNVSDIVGSGAVSIYGDRLGKRRSVILGLLLMIIGFVTLPLFNFSLIAAVAAVFFTRAAFEFAIVGNLILSSEQSIKRRVQVMAVISTGGILGSTIATFIGPSLFNQLNVLGITLMGTISGIIALILVWKFASDSLVE